MTRATLIHWIVKTLLLDGDGNCVVQVIGSESDGRSYIDQLRPIRREWCPLCRTAGATALRSAA